MTMNVNLTPELVKFVRRKIKGGRFNSASEVVCDALRKELEAEERRSEMDRLIDEGRLSKRVSETKAQREVWSYIRHRKKNRSRQGTQKRAA
jgi:putative addiction module CopG family antidote